MAGSCVAVSEALNSLCFLVLVTVVHEHVAYGCLLNNCGCTIQNSTEKGDKSSPVFASAVKKEVDTKVNCQNINPPIYNITPSFISNLPEGTTVLDLSGNNVMILEANVFQGLPMLRRLNLSGNPISDIQSNSFNGLENLERLDLSGMTLDVLNALMFEGLPKLRRLYLYGTAIQKIQLGTADVLPALKWLGLQTDLLVCDCHLRWVMTWLSDRAGRLNGSAVCAKPSGLKGKSLKKLTESDLVCDSLSELQVYELTPSADQIVFAGDMLPFQCRASLVDRDISLTWLHNDKLIVSNHTLGIFIHDESLPSQVLLTTMVLERLVVAHSGTWKCLVRSAKSHAAKSVDIVVLAEDAGYCSRTVTVTTRGTYAWPKTLFGIGQTLPCEVAPSDATRGNRNAVARHACGISGVWAELDVSQCSFTSQKTRDLEAIYLFSLLSANGSCQANCVKQILQKIAESSRLLGNFENASVEDLIFLSRIINAFSKNIQNVDVIKGLVNLTSSLMEMDSTLLIEAQRIEQACSRTVNAVEEMAEQLLRTMPKVDLHSKNIAIHARRIQPYLFVGINCTSWIGSNQTHLTCNTNREGRSTDKGQFNASIAIPTDFVTQIQCTASSFCPQNDTIHVQSIIYRNAKLFPVDETVSAFEVTSAVIASRIAGVHVVNSSSQITVSVLSPISGRSKLPVHWDFSANEKQGAWLSTGCVMTSDALPVLTFKCNHLTNFAIAEFRLPPLTDFEALLLACYNTSAINYIGSVVLTVCLTTVFVVYIVHRGNLQMSRKMRHAVANLCLCVALLCIIYTFGIRLYRLPVLCRVAGIALHYLSLCTLLWITAITFKILHHLSKQLTSHQPSPEELNGEPPKPKPIIAGYLLGWGVAIIICGISGATNWTNYQQFNKYCFLPKDAALTTVFVPAGILGFFNVVLFMRIFCLIRRIPSPILSSTPVKTADVTVLDEAQDNETQLLSSNQAANGGTGTIPDSNRSSSPFASQSHPADKTYGPGSQLCAVVLALVLYCSTWLAGALAVTLPVENGPSHRDILFQCLYAVLASALGVFILAFYCAGRKDIRRSCCSSWRSLNRWRYVPANGSAAVSSKGPSEERAVSEVPLGAETASLANGSVISNGINGSNAPSTAAVPQPTVGLEPSFTSVADSSIFYNPHQNGIAKKYWERNKRSRVVQLRKEVSRGAPVDGIELLGTHNGSVATGQGVDCLPTAFCDLEIRIEQPSISRIEKLPASKTDIPLCLDKPPLPILLPVLPQELHVNNETSDKLVARSKRYSEPPSTNLERSPVSTQNEFTNLPNGIKRSKASTVGTLNLNRTCNSFHEPAENGFLEQLELRIPPRGILVEELPPRSIIPAKVNSLELGQTVDNASASYDQKPRLTLVSGQRDDDANGNKDGNGPGVKQPATSDCEFPSKKAIQMGNGCPLGITDSRETRSHSDASTLSQDGGTLGIWKE